MDNKYDSSLFPRALYDSKKPKLCYQPNRSKEERDAWIADLRKSVIKHMAFSEDLYETPIVNLLCKKDRGAYTVEKYEISTEPHLWMTFLLLVPKGASEQNKTPAVLCTPGTCWPKETLAGEEFYDLSYEPAQQPGGPRYGGGRYFYANAMAQHYALHGFTALACDDLTIGEHAGSITSKTVNELLICLGRSMFGITVEVRLALLRWLKERPFVDRSRLAVSGHSLGTDSASCLALLDEDVKAFVYNDGLCDMPVRLSHTCPPEEMPLSFWQFYHGMHNDYSYPDLLAAYAPRKLFITEGGRTESLLKLKNAYKELGAEENFRYDYFQKFADPASRIFDDTPLHHNMTNMEYLTYANCDGDKHFFKYEQAIPWLIDALK